MEEEWREVPSYENLYEASNLGNIRSLNWKHTGKVVVMKPGTDKNGYKYINLTKDKKNKWLKVHRVIYETFFDKIPEGMEINHINEIKSDNRPENLEIVSHKQNINHGTCKERAGEKHHKPVVRYSKTGDFIDEWESMSAASSALSIDVAQISACCKGKPHYNTAGGFIWRYKEKEAE